MVGNEASEEPRFLVWPYIIPNDVKKQFEDALMLKGRIYLRLPAFPQGMACIVKAQSVLTLQHCSIMQFLISHFDDGKA